MTRILLRHARMLACLAAFVPAALVQAQERVSAGAYVRIFAPSAADSLLTGYLVAIDSGSLLLAPRAGGSREVPVVEIQGLEVLRRGPRQTIAGAALGTVAGAALGYAITSIAGPELDCEPLCETAAVNGGIIGGLLGMYMGGLFGSRHRAPGRWEPVPVNALRGDP